MICLLPSHLLAEWDVTCQRWLTVPSAAGKLRGKIRTSISVVPNGRPGSREGPLQTWWYQYLVGLVHFSCNSNHRVTFEPYLNPTVRFDWSLSAVIKYMIWQNTANVNGGRSLFIKTGRVTTVTISKPYAFIHIWAFLFWIYIFSVFILHLQLGGIWLGQTGPHHTCVIRFNRPLLLSLQIFLFGFIQMQMKNQAPRGVLGEGGRGGAT